MGIIKIPQFHADLRSEGIIHNKCIKGKDNPEKLFFWESPQKNCLMGLNCFGAFFQNNFFISEISRAKIKDFLTPIVAYFTIRITRDEYRKKRI
jgi:hypothetical protein